jgi:predicted MFS family arabinose efflux permease
MGPILVLAVLLGTITAFDLPARQVLVAQVVDKEELPNAIALQSTLFHGSRILGPALAGIVVAASGEGWCFVLNAVSYLAALATLFIIHTHPVVDAPRGRGSLDHLAEGFRFIWNEKTFRHLIGLLLIIVGLGMPFTALLPAVAKGTLHVGPRGLGWLGAASGLGATLGAVLLASRKNVLGLERALVVFALLFALFLGAFAMTHRFWLALAILPFASFCLASVNTSCNTLAQIMAPDALRGRVMALYTMVFMAAMPIGTLGMGFLAQYVSLSWALTIGAAGCLIGGLIFAANFPKSTMKPLESGLH